MPANATVDPNVTLPPHVLAQAARAEELMRFSRGEPPRDEQAETPSQEQPEKPPQEAQDGDAREGVAKGQKGEEGRQEPQESRQAQDARADAHPENWEHRYNSMKGRYDAAQSQVKQLADEVASLRRLMGTMQTQVQPEAHPAASVQEQVERLITPEEERDYGSEFLTVVGKKAQEVVGSVTAKYEKKIAELEQKLSGVQGTVIVSEQQRMHETLDNRVPNWREINANQEFIEWLQYPDTYSGQTRLDLLKSAYERNDAARVAAFFEGFQREAAAVAPRDSQQAPSSRAPAPAKPSLEHFAAPGRAKAAAPQSGPADKPVISRAQIAKFYADVTAGKYRGREAEQKSFENQIFEAQSEGRIR